MHEDILIIISLLFAVSMLVMLGQKLRISYPIFLVLGGLLISLIPGTPHISISPELVFLIFLPPLLYEAAWYTSWYDFWKWKRPIGLLAFGLVIFTSTAVAFISEALIPGFTLALGFLLGGIISPPDAVAATSVLKGLKVPKRALTILEGESLVNDASSLIIFRFAIAAIVSGQFVLQNAVLDFFVVAGMGIVMGLAIAHVFYVIHRFLPTTPSIDTALTLMTPYIMYISAEHFHYSGVMAVVSGGLFLSFRSHDFLKHDSRIQAVGVWATLSFILNGLVFILIGLQLPVIVEGLGDYSMEEAIRYGVLISLVIILVRLIWIYPATYIPRWLSKKIRSTEPRPPFKAVFLVGWSGMRGVVSLAAALSVPLFLTTGEAFPHRNLILFITFIVILFTLVLQGLSLPWIIKLLKVQEIDVVLPEEEQQAAIRVRMMKASLDHIDKNYGEHLKHNELLVTLKKQYENEVFFTTQKIEEFECAKEVREMYNKVLNEVIGIQRKELVSIRKEKIFDHEVLRRQEMHLDIEQARIN